MRKTIKTAADLSKAQSAALDKIAQMGGHGYGEHSGILSRTVAILEAAGLVTLGRKPVSGSGKRIPWAIITNGVRPYGFETDADIRAANAAAMDRINARNEARVTAVLAASRAKGPKAGETPEQMEARLVEAAKMLRKADGSVEFSALTMAECVLGIKA